MPAHPQPPSYGLWQLDKQPAIYRSAPGEAINDIVIFATGDVPVQVRLEGNTVWLTQLQMAELFDTSADNISLHLRNIYADVELQEPATTEEFAHIEPKGSGCRW